MKMFSTIQRPSRSFTMITLSLLPPPMSTKGSSAAPMWTAVGAFSMMVMAGSPSTGRDGGAAGTVPNLRPVIAGRPPACDDGAGRGTARSAGALGQGDGRQPVAVAGVVHLDADQAGGDQLGRGPSRPDPDGAGEAHVEIEHRGAGEGLGRHLGHHGDRPALDGPGRLH